MSLADSNIPRVINGRWLGFSNSCLTVKCLLIVWIGVSRYHYESEYLQVKQSTRKLLLTLIRVRPVTRRQFQITTLKKFLAALSVTCDSVGCIPGRLSALFIINCVEAEYLSQLEETTAIPFLVIRCQGLPCLLPLSQQPTV
jgi:hypothetical protein